MFYKIKEKAIEAWNRRADLAADVAEKKDGLIAAITLIRDECRKHDQSCTDCPIDDYCHKAGPMMYGTPPCYWGGFEEETNANNSNSI